MTSLPRTAGFSRPDEALKANAIHARQIAKQQECAMFYMSQLSAEAEGKVVLNQAMMEGSRTGKAAEADLMIMISKNPTVEGKRKKTTNATSMSLRTSCLGGMVLYTLILSTRLHVT